MKSKLEAAAKVAKRIVNDLLMRPDVKDKEGNYCLAQDEHLMWVIVTGHVRQFEVATEKRVARERAEQFAEWCDDNWFRIGRSNKWTKHCNPDTRIEDIYTTSELYDIFLKETNTLSASSLLVNIPTTKLW